MEVVITCGDDFIGLAAIRQYINETTRRFIDLDVLNCVFDFELFAFLGTRPECYFEQFDIGVFERVFSACSPGKSFHLAAELRADRFVDGLAVFNMKNIGMSFSYV